MYIAMGMGALITNYLQKVIRHEKDDSSPPYLNFDPFYQGGRLAATLVDDVIGYMYSSMPVSMQWTLPNSW